MKTPGFTPAFKIASDRPYWRKCFHTAFATFPAGGSGIFFMSCRMPAAITTTATTVVPIQINTASKGHPS
jgi:hypothetical protein